MGLLYLPVAYGGKVVQGQLYVVKCQGPSLWGRDLIKVQNLLEDDYVGRIETESQVLETVRELEKKFKDLFQAGTAGMP